MISLIQRTPKIQLPPLGTAARFPLRWFQSRVEYDSYSKRVRSSCLGRPQDLKEIKVPKVMTDVDPMAQHLKVLAMPDGGGNLGTAAASMMEIVYPLSTDEQLQTSVSDLGCWSTFRLSKFYEKLDMLTAIVAVRHIGNADDALAVVTASHNHSRKFEKTLVNQDVLLRCYLTRVGGASVEVRTDALQCDADGTEILLNTCATTMVVVDKETLRPVKKGSIPELTPPSGEDALADGKSFAVRSELAIQHQELRDEQQKRSIRLRGKTSVPPTPDELLHIHELQREVVAGKESNPPVHIRTISESTHITSCVIFPENRNFNGKSFGGFLVGEAMNLAHYAATFFSRSGNAVPMGLDECVFNQPIGIGDMVRFRAHVVHCTRFTCRVEVHVEVLDPEHANVAPRRSNRMIFVFATEAPPGGIVPVTYGEILMYLDARRSSTTKGPDDDFAMDILYHACDLDSPGARHMFPDKK